MPNHGHADLITSFYTAFQRLDAGAMVACYHDRVTFSDPAFPGLQGDRAKAMWRMLCARAQDFELTFGAVEAGAERGSAPWDATYTFGAKGKLLGWLPPVQNAIRKESARMLDRYIEAQQR